MDAMPVNLSRLARLGLRFPLPADVAERRRVAIQIAIAFSIIAVAGLLRLSWVQDIEYKVDEAWTFLMVTHGGIDVPFPTLGMPTSYEVRHPGGTIWVFMALGKLFAVESPTDLARACQIVNTLAIALLVLFAYWCVSKDQREPWLWAAALAAVNPLAVLFHRKIWPPSIVPLFAVLTLIAWWHRDRRAGAFFWGMLSVGLTQIHPAGMFLATGFAAWALLFDRRGVRWRWWFGGALLAGLTLLPWLWYAFQTMAANPISQRRWTNIVTGRFWTNWIMEPLGLTLQYALGKDFTDFLRQPLIGETPTYLVGGLHLLMVPVGAAAILFGIVAVVRRESSFVSVLVGRGSPTAFTVSAGLFGFGLVFTFTGLPMHRHYMNLTFPLMFVWLAYLATANPGTCFGGRLTRGRALLAAAVLLQFAVFASFLTYIHFNQRPIRGDYGTPYAAQPDDRKGFR